MHILTYLIPRTTFLTYCNIFSFICVFLFVVVLLCEKCTYFNILYFRFEYTEQIWFLSCETAHGAAARSNVGVDDAKHHIPIYAVTRKKNTELDSFDMSM